MHGLEPVAHLPTSQSSVNDSGGVLSLGTIVKPQYQTVGTDSLELEKLPYVLKYNPSRFVRRFRSLSNVLFLSAIVKPQIPHTKLPEPIFLKLGKPPSLRSTRLSYRLRSYKLLLFVHRISCSAIM
jgi:hypothetical protein